jgi:GT2 family glycosyltransferase
MSSPSVFIIIVTYRMKAELRRCLESLRDLQYPNYRIVVVDNGEDDGTAAMVQSEFAPAVAIRTGKNLGYTGGNNRGIEFAVSERADYVLILNPDTFVENPHFLNQMIAYLQNQPRVGIAGPRVFLREKGRIQNTVLFAPGLWHNIRTWVASRIDPGRFQISGDAVVEAEVLNGVCLLIRVACLKEIGLFDENIFMYIEDVEMDDRARRHGWQIRYLPIDSITHDQKVGGYHMTSNVNFFIKRNSVYYLSKIGKRVDAWGYSMLSILLMAAHALSPFKREPFLDHIQFCRRLTRAYRQILSGRPLDESFGPPYAS